MSLSSFSSHPCTSQNLFWSICNWLVCLCVSLYWSKSPTGAFAILLGTLYTNTIYLGIYYTQNKRQQFNKELLKEGGMKNLFKIIVGKLIVMLYLWFPPFLVFHFLPFHSLPSPPLFIHRSMGQNTFHTILHT